ncbi:MAG TPA: hypothetical protein VL326_08805 [Kofleriaceae bacterium]|jgi:hypothetical protein|nr:hypothetical protein [Kofleriaceae bacterium]
MRALAMVVAAATMFAAPAADADTKGVPPLAPLPPGPQPKPPKKWTVMVTLTEQVSSQCGGAAYRAELDELHVLVGATYLVRRGKKNAPGKVIAQATSDSAGHLYFNLPKGAYCLITPDKKDVSNKTLPENLAPVAPPIGTNAAGIGASPGLSNEDKKYCDLVVVAPTKTAKLGSFRSTCPPLPPGTSPPP